MTGNEQVQGYYPKIANNNREMITVGFLIFFADSHLSIAEW